MRKSSWIVLALLVVCSAPVAHADTFTPTFTCTSGCTTPPTAPDVTFPSPALTITFQGLTFDFDFLPSSNLPGDDYTWAATLDCGKIICLASISTTDVSAATTVQSIPPVFVHMPDFNVGSGDLTFTSVTAPEPSSLLLAFPGLGALLLMRKRMGHNNPSAV